MSSCARGAGHGACCLLGHRRMSQASRGNRGDGQCAGVISSPSYRRLLGRPRVAGHARGLGEAGPRASGSPRSEARTKHRGRRAAPRPTLQSQTTEYQSTGCRRTGARGSSPGPGGSTSTESPGQPLLASERLGALAFARMSIRPASLTLSSARRPRPVPRTIFRRRASCLRGDGRESPRSGSKRRRRTTGRKRTSSTCGRAREIVA